jgi:hypothetical protein
VRSLGYVCVLLPLEKLIVGRAPRLYNLPSKTSFVENAGSRDGERERERVADCSKSSSDQDASDQDVSDCLVEVQKQWEGFFF